MFFFKPDQEVMSQEQIKHWKQQRMLLACSIVYYWFLNLFSWLVFVFFLALLDVLGLVLGL